MLIEHDSGLKNRCSPGRFREIAIDNLSLPGGSTLYFTVYAAGRFSITDSNHNRHNEITGSSSTVSNINMKYMCMHNTSLSHLYKLCVFLHIRVGAKALWALEERGEEGLLLPRRKPTLADSVRALRA